MTVGSALLTTYEGKYVVLKLLWQCALFLDQLYDVQVTGDVSVLHLPYMLINFKSLLLYLITVFKKGGGFSYILMCKYDLKLSSV